MRRNQFQNADSTHGGQLDFRFMWKINGNYGPETRKVFLWSSIWANYVCIYIYNVHIAFIKGVTIGKLPGPLQLTRYKEYVYIVIFVYPESGVNQIIPPPQKTRSPIKVACLFQKHVGERIFWWKPTVQVCIFPQKKTTKTTFDIRIHSYPTKSPENKS